MVYAWMRCFLLDTLGFCRHGCAVLKQILFSLQLRTCGFLIDALVFARKDFLFSRSCSCFCRKRRVVFQQMLSILLFASGAVSQQILSLLFFFKWCCFLVDTLNIFSSSSGVVFQQILSILFFLQVVLFLVDVLDIVFFFKWCCFLVDALNIVVFQWCCFLVNTHMLQRRRCCFFVDTIVLGENEVLFICKYSLLEEKEVLFSRTQLLLCYEKKRCCFLVDYLQLEDHEVLFSYSYFSARSRRERGSVFSQLLMRTERMSCCFRIVTHAGRE